MAAVELFTSVYHHWSPYGYVPTLWVCALFIALFSISTILHLGQALMSRRWFLLPTLVVGGIGEIIGWSARAWSAKNVSLPTPFLMQISTTIFAPTFLSAANFIILGVIINVVGAEYSRLSARNYAIIFVSVDIFALVVQAIGGGMASSAAQTIGGNPNLGGRVMLGGIVIQLVAITIYAALAADFLRNFVRGNPVRIVVATGDPGNRVLGGEGTLAEEEKEGSEIITGTDDRMKLMILALILSTLFLFIRSVYRTIELSDGWGGRIIHTQVYFNVLDGAMIVLAMWTINFLHPLYLLRTR